MNIKSRGIFFVIPTEPDDFVPEVPTALLRRRGIYRIIYKVDFLSVWRNVNLSSCAQPTIAEERETDRYFEFKSISVTQYATHTVLWRFHKSGYYRPTDGYVRYVLLRCALPRIVQTLHDGIYGGELSSATVREFVGSLWYFNTRQIGGDKVLDTDFTETSDSFFYTVTSTGVNYGDWGLFDEIRVFKSTFELDKNFRKLRSTDCALLRTIQGRLN